MPVASVLVCGGGIAGAELSLALARRNLEVSFAVGADDLTEPLRDDLRAAAVEVRVGAELIGVVAVDRHVEAELSDGHVENYDAVVAPSPDGGWRLTAGRDGRQADVIAETIRALP